MGCGVWGVGCGDEHLWREKVGANRGDAPGKNLFAGFAGLAFRWRVRMVNPGLIT